MLKLVSNRVVSKELNLCDLCQQILFCLRVSMHGTKMSIHFRNVFWALAGCVFILGEWSFRSCRKWDNVQDEILALSKFALHHAEEGFLNKSLQVRDRILAAELVISSKILEMLTNPGDAVLGCLHFLQQLHDLPEIKKAFSLDSNEMNKSMRDLTASVHKINMIMFEFASMFIKAPPNLKDWPTTIKLEDQILNPLTDGVLVEIEGSKTVFKRKYLDANEVESKTDKSTAQTSEHCLPFIESTDNR